MLSLDGSAWLPTSSEGVTREAYPILATIDAPPCTDGCCTGCVRYLGRVGGPCFS